MKKLLVSDKVYVSSSKIINAGRGVYAKRNIKKGEIIETCPIILVSKYDTSKLEESILVTYFFYTGKKKEELAVALGFGSIYNHSYRPNAKYKINRTKKLLEFTALRNIKKDEEITFNYKQGNTKNNVPLWFEAV